MNNIDSKKQFVEFDNQKFDNSSIFGIIGMGNIGIATINGFIQRELLPKQRLWISNYNGPHKLDHTPRDNFGIKYEVYGQQKDKEAAFTGI